jgi:hypothetical protein
MVLKALFGSTPFDWSKSPAHQLLLTEFLRPKDPAELHQGWLGALKEPIPIAIDRFEKLKLLQRGTLADVLDYILKVDDLKKYLRECKAKLTGRKVELIQRLIDVAPQKAAALGQGKYVFICTSAGKELAESYLAKSRAEREKTELATLDALCNGQLDKACMLVANYEASQPFQRGLGTTYDPNRDLRILKFIFNEIPAILKGVSTQNVNVLKPVAGMMLLWGQSRPLPQWLPINYSTDHHYTPDVVARMLMFNGIHRDTLNRYLQFDTKFVEISGTDDSCSECQRLAGKKYKISEAPLLPYHKCSNERGCRCAYLPVVGMEK